MFGFFIIYGFFFLFLLVFFYYIFCLFWKNSKPIRSCVLGSTSHRNLRALPSRSALGCASGTTLGQRAQLSMLGRTSDAASNINLEPIYQSSRPIHLNVRLEFDPGMVGKGVLVCYMTSLRKWYIEKV